VRRISLDGASGNTGGSMTPETQISNIDTLIDVNVCLDVFS